MNDGTAALEKLAFETLAVGGRAENVEEVRCSVPGLDIHVGVGLDAIVSF